MTHESRVNSPGSLVVVLVFPSAFLHVEISVKLLRVYIKWSLVLKHICAGGGNVTFVVYIQFAPYSDVSAAFWATLKGDTMRVVMTAHEY